MCIDYNAYRYFFSSINDHMCKIPQPTGAVRQNFLLFNLLLNYIWTEVLSGALMEILMNSAPCCQLSAYLVVHEYVHDILVDLPS